MNSLFHSKKPFTAVTVAIDQLAGDEQADDNNLSGILNLVELISLQNTGPPEAARAIRKKLKYGNVTCQLRSLTILDNLLQFNGAQLKQILADEMLLERLRFCATSELSDPQVKKRCEILFPSWVVENKDCQVIKEILNLHKQPNQHKPHMIQGRSKELKQTDINPFETDEAKRKISAPPPPPRHFPVLSSPMRSSWTSRPSLLYSSVCQKSGKEISKIKRQKINLFEPNEQKAGIRNKAVEIELEIKYKISEAEIASMNLMNTLKLINSERGQISGNKAAFAQFETCKKLRKKIVYFIQNVESEKLLNKLLQSNDLLMTSLLTYEQLDRSVDAGSESEDERADQHHSIKITPTQAKHREISTGLKISKSMLSSSNQILSHKVTQGFAGLSQDDDENDPFADRNALTSEST